jgi:hypothetical protein
MAETEKERQEREDKERHQKMLAAQALASAERVVEDAERSGEGWSNE